MACEIRVSIHISGDNAGFEIAARQLAAWHRALCADGAKLIEVESAVPVLGFAGSITVLVDSAPSQLYEQPPTPAQIKLFGESQ